MPKGLSPARQGNACFKRVLRGHWPRLNYGSAGALGWMPHSHDHKGAKQGWTAAARGWQRLAPLRSHIKTTGGKSRYTQQTFNRSILTIPFYFSSGEQRRQEEIRSVSFTVCPEVTLLLHLLFLTFRQSIVSCLRPARELLFTWMKIQKKKFLLYGMGNFLLSFF